MNLQLQAQWIGGGIDNGRYEITGLPWYSPNGDYWYEQGTDNLIDSDDFYASTITFFGGPCDRQQGQRMNQAHGSPFDRGSADSFYRRQAIPHHMVDGARIEQADMTAEQIAEYEAGFLENEKRIDSRKDNA